MFSDAELDQMLAPIALYPDVLLTQTLIASTYPSEAIEAGNWLKANPNLRGKEAVEAASQTNWDDSIKSLAAFPEILVPMAEYPDWTAGLGNAFLSQQQQLMNRVQFLRQKAKEQGNLKTNEQVKVQTTGQAANQTIVIEPATTQVVYVPYYNPTVVYGTWWWPAYTPVYWNPWPYAGYATGYSTGFMWSGAGLWFSYTSYRPVYDWHYHRVYIVDRHSRRPGPHRKPVPRREWNHRPDHRHDVSYRDKTYKPGPNTPKPGQHGKPDQKPHGTPGDRPQGRPGSNHTPGKNDRPSFDKDKRPGSSQMGFTDNKHNGSRPGPSKGKPTDIPRKDNPSVNHNRPSSGHVNPVGPGMSGTRPVVNQSGQGASANKPSGNRPEMNGQPDRHQINRPSGNGSAGSSANKQPEQSQSLNRPGSSSRPMLIPSVSNPNNNRPVSPSTGHSSGNRPAAGPGANRPANNRPVQSPVTNRPVNNQTVPGSSVNRPTTNRPTSAPSINRPAGNPSSPGASANSAVNSRPTAASSINRPAINRPTTGSSVDRPAVNRPASNSSASRPSGNRPSSVQSSVNRPTASRPGSSVSRPATNSRPVASSNSRPSSSSASRPSGSRPAASRPSGGGGNRASSAPSRQAPSHQNKPSGSDRKDDRGHGR